MIRLVPRPQAPLWLVVATPLLAIAVALVLGALLFWSMGQEPLSALRTFLVEPVLRVRNDEWVWSPRAAEVLVKAVPLALIAAGLAMGFRAGVWNIGAEGQLTVGAICGAAVGLAFWGTEQWFTGTDAWWTALILPLMLLASLLGGFLWAAIPAFLRTRFNANEILVSLMLTYVAHQLLIYMIHGPLIDPDGFNFPQSRELEPGSRLPLLAAGTRVHLGLIFAVLALVALWFVQGRTALGYGLRLSGESRQAAAYAGVSSKRMIWICLGVSGALAGLAGIGEVAGPVRQLTDSISPGYGFTAIIVAFLGRLHAVGIAFAACFVSLLYLGGERAQIGLGLDDSVAQVFMGLILFLVLASNVLAQYRLQWVPRTRPAASEADIPAAVAEAGPSAAAPSAPASAPPAVPAPQAPAQGGVS